MSRIAALNPQILGPRQREVYDAIASGPRGGVRGPLAVWLHRPELAERAQALGHYCRYDSLLPPRLSELAILVTARVWRSEYEWQAHKKFALQAGLAAEVIEAVRRDEIPIFDQEDEAVVYAFALAAQRDRQVAQPLYDQAVRALGEQAVVDLTGILGYYALISMTINVFDVDPPDPAMIEVS